MTNTEILAAVRQVLTESLALGSRGPALRAESALLGSLPELDSMAVMSVMAALEERFDILADDDDISGETFATLASLSALVERKLAP